MAIKFDSALDSINKRGIAASIVASIPGLTTADKINPKHVNHAVVANIADSVANKHGKYADAEKRKIYMREYMAKKRADKAAAKS